VIVSQLASYKVSVNVINVLDFGSMMIKKMKMCILFDSENVY